MKYYSLALRAAIRRLAILFAMFVAIIGPPSAHSASSGLAVGIAIDTDQATPQFPLGSPVGLKMVVSNSTPWPIYTKLGFSQTEFYQSLVLTGPDGARYNYIPETEKVDTMPPTITFGDRQVILAEALSDGVVKQVVIDDLSQLFPIMETVPGWYTLEARLPFIRFAEIIPVKNFGVLGPVDDVDNIWRGTVVSNKIQFYLFPPSGVKQRFIFCRFIKRV